MPLPHEGSGSGGGGPCRQRPCGTLQRLRILQYDLRDLAACTRVGVTAARVYWRKAQSGTHRDFALLVAAAGTWWLALFGGHDDVVTTLGLGCRRMCG